MVQKQTLSLFRKSAGVVAPPPKLTVSQWADAHRVLSKESSAEPGKWNTDRAPYQREIMDSISDPETTDIVVMSSAQVGKSELINNIIGYYIDYDPSPMLLIQPTLEMAEAYSKDRIAPMIRDTPTLTKKVNSPKAKDGNNTLLQKKFAGGHLTLVGANSPSSLASRPVRIVLADEVDRFPPSAGTEGDPLSLAQKRTKTFWNYKWIMVSTPTIKGASRIEMEYEESTKEQWSVSCPSCGYFQPYSWPQIRFDSVAMECVHCKEQHAEVEWKSRPGQWIARNPEAIKRGFHLNALASPWEKWSRIIGEFKSAKSKGTENLKTWVNTTLGESWEDKTNDQDHEKLISRRIRYNCDVPKEALVLTAGVDVQDDRLEVEVVGWGVNDVSYGINYKIFYGDPGQDAVWNQVDAFLMNDFIRNDGVMLNISAACVDSGGHYTNEVYDFCKAREHRRIFAIKGKGGAGIAYINKPNKVGRQSVHLFSIGVNEGKDIIYSRLKNEFEDKPGYCYFPVEKEKGYDEAYFVGLTAERKVTRFVGGAPKIDWVKRSSNIRNEPLDLRNYALASFRILNPDMKYLAENQLTGNIFNQAVKRKKKRRKGVLSKGV
ncbi:phage terminase large subunit family protein [Solibacillus sp.]|uniref:phage terminase large subunit family protein n=1 Tax=Solibacillus sp. TaxID=1909654 RepID=UPI003315FD70